MIRVNSKHERFVGWCPRLLLVGGLLLAGHVATLALEMFGDVSTPPDLFAPTGHLLGVLALLGLATVYGGRWQRGAWALGGLALGGWVVVSAAQAAKLLGLVPAEGVVPAPFAVGLIVLTALTYAFVAVAGVRVGGHGRGVDLAVAAPAVLLVALLVNFFALGASLVLTLVIASGLAAAELGLGYALWRFEPTVRRVAAPDVVRG